MNIRAFPIRGAVALGLPLWATSASAHVLDASGAGLAEGLLHPFLGLDHLLAMLAVGAWAAQLGGAALWRVPAAFVGVMALAAGLAGWGGEWVGVERMIALSILVLGVFLAARVRVSTAAGMFAVAVFAAFHGHAHGLEMPMAADPLAYGLGFVVATVTLHALGMGLERLSRRRPLLSRLGGGALALSGAYWLAGL